MRAFTGIFNEAIDSFSNTVASCCGWSQEKPAYYVPEKSYGIYDRQPSSVQPPLVEPMRYTRGSSPPWEQAPGRKHDNQSRSAFSVRKRWFPRKERTRRPQISAPSNFCHVSSGGPRLSDHEDTQPSYRPQSFRPLELNMRLSSMMPYFGYPNPPVTPPCRAIVSSSDSDDTFSLKHQQSSSTLSFNIPRKPTPNAGSVFDSPPSDKVRRPAAARIRTRTSPEGQTPAMNELIERVATAMLERDQLQEQIDDVAERQSIYISSRPSTANGRRPSAARSIPDIDMEPMPQVPAMPMSGPSFSERLSFDHPRTAPTKTAAYCPPPTAAMPRAVQAKAAYTAAPGSRRIEGRTPPPPLPLRLRPPLRKKKSFSRVSSWLGFPADAAYTHRRDLSLESITNKPLPVLRDGGFYEVAAPVRGRASSDSDDTTSGWSSEDDRIEEQTLPTSWSPSSSATIRAVEPPRPVMLSQAPWRESVVGVAF